MDKRLSLQSELESLLGSRNVYFQPPATIKMKYPAIVYTLKTIDNIHANNAVFKQDTAYDVIVIDRDPESSIASRVSMMPKCSFDRFYVADNLNHFTFTLYY
jgi:hypothetical protein